MEKQYIVRKKWRDGDGYTGPFCEMAKVTPGKVYASLEEAEAARDALSHAANNQGMFEVVEK